MSLTGLIGSVADDPQLRDALDYLTQPGASDADLVAPAALRPVLIGALASANSPTSATNLASGGQEVDGPPSPPGRPFVLAITATAREAEDLTSALSSLLPDPHAAAYFPAWETLPHERLSPRSDTSGRRLAVLRRLVNPDPGDPRSGPLQVVATPVRSVLQPLVGGLGQLEPVRLDLGDDADLEDTVTRLVEIGYARVDLVANRGELAVRGGILDVFPPTEEHPLRVEFFGSQVEEIRPFKAADQRSLGIPAETLWAPPCRELLLTPGVRHRAKQLAAEYPGLGDVLGKIADGITVEGMEAFAPLLADRMELLFDSLPPGAIAIACDPERIRTRASDLVRTSQEFLEASWVNAAAGAEIPIDLGGAAFKPITEIRASAADLGIRWWTITPFSTGEPSGGTDATAEAAGAWADRPQGDPANDGWLAEPDGRESFQIAASPATAYHGDTVKVLHDVRGWLADAWRVVLVTEGHGPAQRLAELLRSAELGARTGEV